MKFSVLLTHYFYKFKTLNLPGIGTFSIDDSFNVPEGTDKNFRDVFQHIRFEQKNTTQPDDALIDFVRAQTGKIKPLALSDLESFVADGKLLLNIGKPFHIEGIGTLQKNRNGGLEFTPGEPTIEKLESLVPVSEAETARKKSAVSEPPVYRSTSASTGGSKRSLAIVVGLVAALGIIIAGGYILYNRNSGQTIVEIQPDSLSRAESLNLPHKDTLANQQFATSDTPASSTSANTRVTTPSGNYKYVLETTKYKTTALKRWNLLKPRVTLESAPDSSFFKVVMILPGTPQDTTRIKDSLHNWYWGLNRLDRKVIIEQ